MLDIDKLISASGKRLTKQRQAILESLTKAPQSAAQIREALAQKQIFLNKSTIYRNLHSLVKLKIVSATRFQDRTAVYELKDHGHHHHHILCEGCGTIEDIHIDEKSLMQAVAEKSSFQIKNHHLEFFGLCQKCH